PADIRDWLHLQERVVRVYRVLTPVGSGHFRGSNQDDSMVGLGGDGYGIVPPPHEGIGQQLARNMVVGGVSGAEVGEPAVLDIPAGKILPGLAQSLPPIVIGIRKGPVRVGCSPK